MFGNLFKRSPKYAVRLLGTPEERFIMQGEKVQIFKSRDQANTVSKAYAGSTVVVEYPQK